MFEPQIKLGDCIEQMASIPEGSIDLIIADPPYNLGKDYGNKSDSRDRLAYLEFTRNWLAEAKRILQPDGSIFVFMGFRYIARLYMTLEENLGFHFQNWISWHYTQGIGKTKGFSPRHDDILSFSKSTKPTFNLDSVRVPQKFYRSINNMRGANPGDVWGFSHVHYCQDSRTGHPTQKPEGLMERMVLASSNEGDIVLDPFSGSGTTLRVCQQLNRRSIGIEINPDYVAITRERLKEPFHGFDSIDPRMQRIPNDLNNREIREEYFENHKRWFLAHHSSQHDAFEREFRKRYAKCEAQPRLFETGVSYANDAELE